MGSFFGQNDVSNAIAQNSIREAEKASRTNDELRYLINWHLKRLGKITASKFDKIKFKEVKNKGTKKTDLIAWLEKNNIKLLEFEMIDKGFESFTDFKNDALKDMISATPGELILMGEAQTYLDRLLWECDLDPKRLINESMKKGIVPDWISVTSRTLEYGIKYEPVAMRKYSEYTGIKGSPMETMFFDSDRIIAATSDHYGISSECPSGDSEDPILTLSNGVKIRPNKKIVCEIKNPYNGANHYKNLRKEEIDARYYSQCVGNMVCQKADEVHFFSYDDRVVKNKVSLVSLRKEDILDEVEDLEFRLNTFKEIYLKELERFNLKIPNIQI